MVSKDTIPNDSVDSDRTDEVSPFYSTTVLLEKRLQRMRMHLEQRSQEVFQEFIGHPYNEVEQKSRDYTRLAHFTGLLAKSIDKTAAEISETDVAFGKRVPLDSTLRQYLAKGMEKDLLEEIRDIAGNYNDGDKTKLLKQTELYTKKLREVYRIELTSYDNKKDSGWKR